MACARENAATYGFEVGEGDLCAGLPATLRAGVDVLVANVPHVPTAELIHLPRDTRAHEPVAAHDGGADGLAVLGRLADQSRAWLRPGGVLAVELADRQASAGVALLEAAGLSARQARDEDHRTSVVTGRLSR
ncbi:MAG: hypothetical protein R2731_15180 [Nocardioides sp.]